MGSFLRFLIAMYQLAIIFAAVTTWMGPETAAKPYAQFLRRITEPALQPVRRVLPQTGQFDLSPVIVIIVLEVVSKLLIYKMLG